MNEQEQTRFFIDALFGGSSKAIENQEQRGQRAIAKGTHLARDCDYELFEKAGFIFDKDDNSDPVLIGVALPDGWSIQPTPHNMHSDIVDNKGRRRGNFFYKAAFYDRRASANLYSMIKYAVEPINGWNSDNDDIWIGRVYKNADVVFETTSTDLSNVENQRVEIKENMRSTCRAWLNSHYPEWQDALAYWDDSE